MSSNSLKFGTSGLRGLAVELNGLPAYAYTMAFVQMLAAKGQLQKGDKVFVGRDLRPSSPDIAALPWVPSKMPASHRSIAASCPRLR